ncbi:MAG TPA: hypothetical protein VF179_06730 [Thermoanaerobaculia bacterium]|nr:hypothetical protein [Thermoanaerobaculia bacterium]
MADRPVVPPGSTTVPVMRSAAKAAPAWVSPSTSSAAINDVLILAPFMATSFGWGRTADTP